MVSNSSPMTGVAQEDGKHVTNDFDRTQGWNSADVRPSTVNLRKPNSAGPSDAPTPYVKLEKETHPVDASTPHVSLQKQPPPTVPQYTRPEAPVTALSHPPGPEYPQQWPQPARTGPSVAKILGIAAGVVAVVLIGVLFGNLLGSDSSTTTARDTPSGGGSRSAESAGTQPCNALPDIEVTSVNLKRAGLSVRTELSANCADGDVVTDPSFALAISDGNRDVAAGTFDTLGEPIVIPPGGTAEREFVFPDGMHWRIPDVISGGGAGLDVTATKSSSSHATGSTFDGAATLTASGPMPPAHGSPNDAALAGLIDLTAADRGYVTKNLADRWIPQISSKRPGLVAEGITWAPADILGEHLALRQRYDNVRLVWSGDWQTFGGLDWWVTVVGSPSSGPESALSWCVSARLDADHCYAKIVSTSRGVDGTTVLQKR